jgi:hypothetical protein
MLANHWDIQSSFSLYNLDPSQIGVYRFVELEGAYLLAIPATGA